MPDIRIANHGTISILTGATEVGARWLNEHLQDGPMWGEHGHVVEPRFVYDILDGALDEGLEIGT